MPKHFLRMITQGEIGITGLEIAVILIALAVVSGLSFYAAPDARLFAMQESQEAIHSGLAGAPSSPELKENLAVSNVFPLNDAEQLWVTNTNVTAARDRNTYVEGVASTSLSIADAFTTGVVGYYDIAGGSDGLDLSNCDSIAFWIKSSADRGDGVLKLVLGENNRERGVTEELSIPGSALDGVNWHKVTVNLSGRTDYYDAVKSVALVAAADPGPVDIWLGIIGAKRAPSSGNPVKAHVNWTVLATGGTGLTI